MKIVSIQQGKVTWLFEIDELNPRGLDIQPVVLAVKNRYGFSTPSKREDIENRTDGIKFENGRYKLNEREAIGVQLTAYDDGLIAEVKTDTDLAEEFLGDAVAFFQQQIGMHNEPSMGSRELLVSRKMYTSTLVFESQSGFEKVNAILEPICTLLNEASGRDYFVKGFTVGSGGTASNDEIFTIERRASLPLSSNRYFSFARMTTKAHIAVLEKIEAALA